MSQVHANECLLKRPFGLRLLSLIGSGSGAGAGLQVVLARDLTGAAILARPGVTCRLWPRLGSSLEGIVLPVQSVRPGQHAADAGALADVMFDPRDPPHVTHAGACRLVVDHIERYVCSSMHSSDLLLLEDETI
jgi:hypothetical protein